MIFIRLALIFLFSGFALVVYGETEQNRSEDNFIEKILKDNNFTGLSREEFNLSINYYNEGTNLLHNGKYQEAIEAFDKAIKIAPGFVWAYDNKGVALGKMNRLHEAIQAFDDAIRYNPNFIKSYSGKALALNKLSAYDEALKVIDLVINHGQVNPVDYSIKSTALFNLHKLEDAIIAIDKAILLETNFTKRSAYYYNKAIGLTDLGKYQEAIEACELSIKHNPNNHLAISLKEEIQDIIKRKLK